MIVLSNCIVLFQEHLAQGKVVPEKFHTIKVGHHKTCSMEETQNRVLILLPILRVLVMIVVVVVGVYVYVCMCVHLCVCFYMCTCMCACKL